MSCVLDTPSISLSTLSGILSAALKLSADAGNVAAVHADGLYVGSHIDIGDVIWSGRASKSANFLALNGAAVSRSTYALLFAQYGTAFGPGDGSTTFNLPDVQGRALVGVGTNADVSALGLNEGVGTVANRRPKHRTTNALTLPNHVHGTGASPQASFAFYEVGSGGFNYTGSGPGNVVSSTNATVTGGVTTNPAMGGSIGTNNANDPLDTAPYLVLNAFVRAL